MLVLAPQDNRFLSYFALPSPLSGSVQRSPPRGKGECKSRDTSASDCGRLEFQHERSRSGKSVRGERLFGVFRRKPLGYSYNTRLPTTHVRLVLLISFFLLMSAAPVQAESFPFATRAPPDEFILYLKGEADSGGMTVSEQAALGEWSVEVPTSATQDDWIEVAQWTTYARQSGYIFGNLPDEDTSSWDFVIDYRLENAASAQMDVAVEMAVGNHRTTTEKSMGQVFMQGEDTLYVDLDLEDFEITFAAGNTFEITLSVRSFTFESPAGDSTFEFLWGQGHDSYLEGPSSEWWVTAPDLITGSNDTAAFTFSADYTFDDGPIYREGWFFEVMLDVDGEGGMDTSLKEVDRSQLEEGRRGITLHFLWAESYGQPAPQNGTFKADLSYCNPNDGGVRDCVGLSPDEWVIEFVLEPGESDPPPDSGTNSTANESGGEGNITGQDDDGGAGFPLPGFTFIEAIIGFILALVMVRRHRWKRANGARTEP